MLQDTLIKHGVKKGDTLTVALDVSGGMRMELIDEVLRQLAGAAMSLNLRGVRLIQFAATVEFNTKLYPGEFHEIIGVLVRGGGGTLPRCIWPAVRDGGDTRVFVVTDGGFARSDASGADDLDVIYLLIPGFQDEPASGHLGGLKTVVGWLG